MRADGTANGACARLDENLTSETLSTLPCTKAHNCFLSATRNGGWLPDFESVLFFTVSEDDVVLADKFCERSYNDKIHLVIAIDFTATRQIIRQLHDSLISFDRAI